MMKKVSILKYKLLLTFTCVLLLLLNTSCRNKVPEVSGKRYIVLSPEIAEIIALIEGTQHIVGITEECNFPTEYQGIKVVGKFGALNKERIIALKPSIVFATSLEQRKIADELSNLGIKVFVLYPNSVESMLSGIIEIGNSLDQPDRAKAVSDSLRSVISDLKARAAGQPRPKVYLEIYRSPLMSVSDKSFVGELIELSGANNIFDVLERDYCQIKAEDVVAARPDIIICYSQDTMESIRQRMGWQDIPAVKNNRIYFEKDINPDWLLRAGPRCVLGIQRLQEIINNAGK